MRPHEESASFSVMFLSSELNLVESIHALLGVLKPVVRSVYCAAVMAV